MISLWNKREKQERVLAGTFQVLAEYFKTLKYALRSSMMHVVLLKTGTVTPEVLQCWTSF
jgi:hypothetical protein